MSYAEMFGTATKLFNQKCEALSKVVAPYPRERWSICAILFLIYLWSSAWGSHFFVVSYGIFVFLVQNLAEFVSPKYDEDGNPLLPKREDGEYKAFLRQIPEITLWTRTIVSLVMADVISRFHSLDVPVYWPILVAYSIFLFFYLLRERMADMLKHGYVPISWGQVGKKKTTPLS